jgi:hypothetical protein
VSEAVRGLRAWAAALGVLAIVLVRFDVLPLLRGPAPYPPEWQWHYRPRALVRALPALPLGLGLAALVVWSGTASARRRPRRAAVVLIGGALVLGASYPLALLDSEDGGWVAHLVRRTASPGYLSYLGVAASPEAADLRTFLRDYPQRLATLPIHAATHPPGAVLVFRALIEGVERSPAFERRLEGWIASGCGHEADGCGPYVAALTPAARGAALLGALAFHLAAVLALLPIAWMAFQLTREPLGSARAAALWPLVPGTALFIPALDPALALPVMTALAGLRLAVTGERTWSRVAGAVGAAAAGAAAVYLSYGSALLLGLGAAVVVASLPPFVLAQRCRRVMGAVAVVAVAGALLFLAPMVGGHDPLLSARTALAIHGQTYTAQRSYPLWLVFGPVDVAMFLGAPIVVGFAVQVLRAARARRTNVIENPPMRFALATVLAFTALFASGLVRGEVGRLLVPLLPLGLLAGTLRLDDEPGPDAHTAALLAVLLAILDLVMRLNWRI